MGSSAGSIPSAAGHGWRRRSALGSGTTHGKRESLRSWVLCGGVCLLSQLAEVLSEEPCSRRPRGWDPRLPLALPHGSGRDRAGTASSSARSSARAGPTGAAAGGQPSAPTVLVFPSAVGSALPGVPNDTTKTWLSLCGAACRAFSAEPPPPGQVGLPPRSPSLLRGRVARAAAGPCRPRVRAGCAGLGRGRRGSGASGPYYAGC